MAGSAGSMSGAVLEPESVLASERSLRPDWSSQRATPYVDALRAYAATMPMRLNVPSHHGAAHADPGLVELLGPDVFDLDIPPLMPGIDAGSGLHPLDRAQQLAADLWGARRTWFLTNGASQGNVAACIVAGIRGGGILAQRNMHSSLLSGVVLAGLRPSFVLPNIDEHLGVAHVVSAQDVARALAQEPEPALVFIVSPTYFGACADVAAIAEECHRAGVPLVVDEAWGSHFGHHPRLPRSALQSGADLVISSTHKLAGSLTQSAMIHLGRGEHAAALEGPLEQALMLVESTSASSVLKASLDGARRRLAVHGHELLGRAVDLAENLRRGIDSLEGYAVADGHFRELDGIVTNDPLRIVIDVSGSGHSGLELGSLLRARHQVDLEVFTRTAVVAVIGAADDEEQATARLLSGLADLALPGGSDIVEPPAAVLYGGPARLAPGEALRAPSELVELQDGPGRISSDTLSAYPPGIPNVFAGEVLTADVIAFLADVVAQEGYVRGATDPALHRLRVVVE